MCTYLQAEFEHWVYIHVQPNIHNIYIVGVQLVIIYIHVRTWRKCASAILTSFHQVHHARVLAMSVLVFSPLLPINKNHLALSKAQAQQELPGVHVHV